MPVFYDISNLLTTFQMFYIYYQVAILAYKILIKNTPKGIKGENCFTIIIL